MWRCVIIIRDDIFDICKILLGSWGLIAFKYAHLNEFDKSLAEKSCTTEIINYVMQFHVKLLLDPGKSLYELEIFQKGVLLELTYRRSQDICPMTLLYDVIPQIYEQILFASLYPLSIRCDQLYNLDNQVSYMHCK